MKIVKTTVPKQKPDAASLGFGKFFTDHMLTMTYSDGKWNEPQIVPYAPLPLDPSCAVLHYGQSVFEGLKAYRDENGVVRLFRPRDNLKRLNSSCDRLCIPEIDEQAVFDALCELVRLERDWIPTASGTSLYIRPTVIATENSLSVHASHNYLLFVILSPVGAYYARGMTPVKLLTEQEYVRACPGGTGHFKVAGNYAASLKAGERATAAGYDQVLWLDSQDRAFIEEVGSMNMFFALDGKIITPVLHGTILPGITRDSVIKLLKETGHEVDERRISLAEIIEGIKSGSITEAFGSGTAAVISPVGIINHDGVDYRVGDGTIGTISKQVYDRLTGIQTGYLADSFGWSVKL